MRDWMLQEFAREGSNYFKAGYAKLQQSMKEAALSQ